LREPFVRRASVRCAVANCFLSSFVMRGMSTTPRPTGRSAGRRRGRDRSPRRG
jgi:hypothetical protein